MIAISRSEEEDPDEVPTPEMDKEEEKVFEAAFGSMKEKTSKGQRLILSGNGFLLLRNCQGTGPWPG